MIVEIHGETLDLLPGRAVYWPARKTLMVADLHLGKAATFRALGAPVPETPTFETLQRLTDLIDFIAPERLTILGDLFHAREAMVGAPRQAFMEWVHEHRELDIRLIVGNHDRRALATADESLVASIGMSECLEEAPFCLAHDPPSGPREDYVLCGHIHPGFRFVVRGHRSQTAACFWFTEGFGVLPAFGSFTGLALVEPSDGDQIFLCTDREVIRVPC